MAKYIDHSYGKVSILDGNIVYSPNCRRDISIPPVIETEANILLPTPTFLTHDNGVHGTSTVSPAPGPPNHSTPRIRYNFSTIKLADYQKPFWWNVHWGWVSFLPRCPRYNGYILGILADFPRPHELVEHKDRDPVQYSMHNDMVKLWSSLEADLSRMAHYLSILTKCNILKPVLPWVFGYKKMHASRRRALYAIERSRNWFAVWMGMIAYLIAIADTQEIDHRQHPKPSIPSWFDFLLENCCNPAWLDSFSSSEVCNYTRDIRVGVFVDPLKRSQGDLQPSVEWLCHYGVPVWYIWNENYDKESSKYQYLTPLPHQLQSATTTIASQPSVTVSSNDQMATLRLNEAENSHQSVGQRRITWQDFFANRAKRNHEQMIKETAAQRRSREDRAKNPPHSVKVFVWEEDKSGALVRESVEPKERLDVLGMYSTDQIQYDSFANKYDCSEAFGPGDGYNQLDYFESGEDPCDSEILSEDELSEITSNLLDSTSKMPRSSLVISTYDDQGATDWLPPDCVQNVQNDSVADKAENEILEILCFYFGYTTPLPALPTVVISKEADQKNFLKIIGIPWKTCPREVFRRPRVSAAFRFMQRLCQKGVISDNEWDFSRNHRDTLVLNKQVQCVKQVRQASSTSKSLYMFDFGTLRKKDWKLAVTSAADAIMICRLDSQYNEVDIALFLLQHGIPFHTLQLSSVAPCPQSLGSSRPIECPIRPPNYKFDVTDYAVYMERSTQLLHGPPGHAALMKGGYLWRIAVPIVSFDMVFNGPVMQSSKYFTVETDSGETYIDNQLTQWESDILSGVYLCSTGEGTQISKKSWYPLHNTYENSGHDYGRWTANSEAIFDMFHNRNRSATKGITVLQRQPLPSNKWRDTTRGSGDLRRAKQLLEDASSALIAGLH